MHRDEHVRLGQVGNFCSLFEGKIVIVLPGVDNFGAQTALDQFPEALHDVEHEIFFHQTFASHGAKVPASMSGIKHQAELCNMSLWLRVRLASNLGGIGSGLRLIAVRRARILFLRVRYFQVGRRVVRFNFRHFGLRGIGAAPCSGAAAFLISTTRR